ncbi:MAG: 50S ribosomal protein L44e [Candidatus Pacearchaeota archaeon]|nr:50S ribosomal protein L44e [Candidatus Pacearchaeota archaeon]
MKFPKETRRYCPYCKKHTKHTISILSAGRQRGSLRRGSLARARKRGLGRGKGNLGRWGSKRAVSKWKRRIKSTQRKVLLYKCQECGKIKGKSQGIRTSKITIG